MGQVEAILPELDRMFGEEDVHYLNWTEKVPSKYMRLLCSKEMGGKRCPFCVWFLIDEHDPDSLNGAEP